MRYIVYIWIDLNEATMKIATVREELMGLIAQEDDLQVLEAIMVLLSKKSVDHSVNEQERLTEAALRSEEDIKAGNLLTRQQVEARMKAKIESGNE